MRSVRKINYGLVPNSSVGPLCHRHEINQYKKATKGRIIYIYDHLKPKLFQIARLACCSDALLVDLQRFTIHNFSWSRNVSFLLCLLDKKEQRKKKIKSK